MNLKIKFTILGLIFVLSTLFFWSAINDALQPSRAQLANTLNVIWSKNNVDCNPGGLCLVHMFGNTQAGDGLAGVQGIIEHSGNIKPIALIESDECSPSFNLDQQLRFKTDPTARTLSFAVGTLQSNTGLVDGGPNCIKSLIIQPQGAASGDQGKLVFGDVSQWRAGGVNPLSVTISSPEIAINFTDTIPIPSITPPTPPTDPRNPPGSDCSKRPQGDCTCDGAIDLFDWDVARAALRGEGGEQCDINGDGTPNAIDLQIWKQNNDLVK